MPASLSPQSGPARILFRNRPALSFGRTSFLRTVLFLFLGAILATTAAAETGAPVRIGVLAKRGKDQCRQKWQQTIAYLNQTLPERKFSLTCLDFTELPRTVARGELSFVLSNPSMYAVLEHDYGTSRIATLKNRAGSTAFTRFGGVIFTRADRDDILDSRYLHNKRFMAVDRDSFGGWIAARRHLLAKGIDPDRDFRHLSFGHTHDNVVRAVLNREVDAGTVRTDILERMAAEGAIDLDNVKVLDRVLVEEEFPFLCSTRLYPEWPLAKTRETGEPLARQVAVSLLSLSAAHPACQAARIMGWTIPLNYQSVRECLQELHLPPYDQPGTISLARFFKEYQSWMLAILALLALIVGAIIHVAFLNRRLRAATIGLDRELATRKKLLLELGEFKETLDRINDCVFMFDPATGQIEYANRGALVQTGYSYGELLAMTMTDLLPGDDHEVFREVSTSLRQQASESRSLATSHIRKNGDRVPVEIFLQYVRQESGRAIFVAIAHDIGKRLAEEREKEQLQARLLHTQKLESVGQLAAGIAHEINTPVQYVGTNIEFLDDAFTDLAGLVNRFLDLLDYLEQHDLAPDATRQCRTKLEEIDWPYLREEIPTAIAQSRDGIARVTSIVRAMKEFSHPGTREMAPVDLNRLLETTITIARNEWKYAAEMETELDPDLPQAPCLSDEMGQVFLNLIINAAHAIAEKFGDRPEGEKGTIRISTRTRADMVEIRISDNGAGIPEEIRKRIFDPFFTTKEVGKGTGQGLAIARDVIVNKHGGSIEVESVAGQGTTFIITLPLTNGTQAP
jgi:two-component system sensor histidine kinase TtrS